MNDVLGKFAVVDEANSSNLEFQPILLDSLTDMLSELRLEGWANLDLLVDVVAAAAHVEDVDTQGRELLSEARGAFQVPGRLAGVFYPLGRGETEPERHVLGDDGADGRDDFSGEAGAVFEAAAVFVGSLLVTR